MCNIDNFQDFCDALRETGFSTGNENSGGIFTLLVKKEDTDLGISDRIHWHTEDPETDPWEWRMRVLTECQDIAYAKLFFNKSGYITKEWYPYFLAARRKGKAFEEMYEDGMISNCARQIYQLLADHKVLPLHEIKDMTGFGKEDKSKFDRALTELQMKMLITMCGQRQKLSFQGEKYGWHSTVFCLTEDFFDADVYASASAITPSAAEEHIRQRILQLNVHADKKKITKFIFG